MKIQISKGDLLQVCAEHGFVLGNDKTLEIMRGALTKGDSLATLEMALKAAIWAIIKTAADDAEEDEDA